MFWSLSFCGFWGFDVAKWLAVFIVGLGVMQDDIWICHCLDIFILRVKMLASCFFEMMRVSGSPQEVFFFLQSYYIWVCWICWDSSKTFRGLTFFYILHVGYLNQKTLVDWSFPPFPGLLSHYGTKRGCFGKGKSSKSSWIWVSMLVKYIIWFDIR